jgi:hypothetical protein
VSAYIALMTPMVDEACLIAALADVGFDRSKIEVHASPVALLGYEGDRRAQCANIVIRRQHIGRASNDVGFLASPTGYQALVSGYDHPRFGPGWLSELHQRYQAQWAAKVETLAAEERQRVEAERQHLVEAQRLAVHEKARKLGYRVEETREGDSIRLVLVKRTY